MEDDNIKNSLGLLFVFLGVYLFYTVIMLKIDIIAQRTEAHLQKVSADLQWDDYFHKRMIEKISKHDNP